MPPPTPIGAQPAGASQRRYLPEVRQRTSASEREANRRGKTKALKPDDQVVAVEVPRLIDQATFDAVQSTLKGRNPKVLPARVVSGPTLLTGICFCADCGGP